MDQDYLCFMMKPVNYLCRLLGIASYSISDIKNYDHKTGNKFWKLLWPYLLAIVLMCCYVYRILFTFQVESQVVHHNLLVTDFLNTSIEYIGCVILIIIRSINHQRNISLILKKFTLLNERFFKYRNEFIAQNVISPVIQVTLSLLLIFFFILSCVNVFVWSTHWLPWLIICEEWCAFTIFVINVKFVLLVQCYRYRHKELNCQIAMLNDLTGPTVRTVVLQDVRETLILEYSSNCRVSYQPSEAVVRSTDTSRKTLFLNRVKALREDHLDLFELSQLLNSKYGFQILICFSLIFFQHILNYNFVIDLMLKLLSGKDGIATDVQEYASLCMAILSSVALIFLTVSCHMASVEANSSQLLVHKLLLSKDLSSDVTVQLQLFSSQVSNLKVKFKICGLFTINASLLSTIAGVICTYLIILYQFK
ncbi:putative gustatory receptor 28b [Zootermopsis nevadensis]|uniref:Gustatory receptor n=1 Tax=Zootermopsis nevadensis TaxID=136037 RepID=A0A067RMK8_ZOONE|nr:putative gustatory receptor 28b [Zootermopsis nevadensis]KDR24258.1 hypothetical protein L798_06727 [Zootermopsis nevadensis]